jgi:GcrA cell cycle regulator
MNEQITSVKTQLALRENFIGPPTEAGAVAMNVPVPKPAKRKLVTTVALTIDTCRWPVGDPVESDFHYCGELPLIGRPYCDMHDAQSQAVRRKKTAA